MADKYHSIHTGQVIDSAITKALNPSTTFNPEDEGKLADAKAVGELVNAEKERADETYLPYDGYSQLARVGEADVADNLTPYSSDSGTSQNTPFILQGSGCANGEEQADTGSYCQLQRKNGNTVVVNQYAKELNSTNWSFTSATGTFGTNSATFTATGTYGRVIQTQGVSVITGHKYFFSAIVKTTSDMSTGLEVRYSGPVHNFDLTVGSTTNTQYLCNIFTSQDTGAGNIYARDARASDWDAITVSDFHFIDLTLWFGSNDKIPTHLLNNPQDFFRYYQGSLAYNVGTLTDCNGRYLKTTGRNVWDEELTKGYYWANVGANNTMAKTAHPDRACTTNPIKVIPNDTYYFRIPSSYNTGWNVWFADIEGHYISNTGWVNHTTVVVPANAFLMYVTLDKNITYNHDITISLYYEGESGYDQYYQYEELANIDTGNEPLLAFDWKEPNGTIHHDTLPKINLGDLTWSRMEYPESSGKYVFYVSNTSQKKDVAKYICSKYAYTLDGIGSIADKCVTPLGGDGRSIWIRDDSYTDAATFKSAMSGVYLEAEAETPTTEQGTPFAENVAIDDFGTMAFDCPNGVPQGNTVFYPVDYKAEIDTLHNITDGDMHKIALKGDLAEGEPETIEEVIDYINARIPEPPAEDGTYALKCTVASGVKTYSWVSAT